MPLSLHTFAGPGTSNPSHQLSFHLTYETPTQSESLFWYTGHMTRAGSLLRMKVQTSSSSSAETSSSLVLLDEAMFFAATPEELGLFEHHGFTRSPPSLVVSPGEVGFKDLARVREYVFSSLQTSQQRERDKARAMANLEDEDDQEERIPRLICHSLSPDLTNTSLNKHSLLTSCDEWTWRRGRVFTVVALWHGRGNLAPDLPPTLPGQVNYWLSYDATSGTTPAGSQSHWEYSLHNRYPEGGLNDALHVRGYQKIAEGLNGYTSPHFHDWTRTPHALVGYVILKALQHFFLTIFLLLFALGYGLWLMYKMWRRMSRETMRQKEKTDEESVEGEVSCPEFITSWTRTWLTGSQNSRSPSLELRVMDRTHSGSIIEGPINEETQSLLHDVEE
jgi:hypothetical protein